MTYSTPGGGITGASYRKKYSVTLADLKAAGNGTTTDFTLETLPAGVIVTNTRVKHSVAITGTVSATARLFLQTISTPFSNATLDVFSTNPVGNTLDTSEKTHPHLNGGTLAAACLPVQGSIATTNVFGMRIVTGAAINGALTGNIDAWIEYIILI